MQFVLSAFVLVYASLTSSTPITKGTPDNPPLQWAPCALDGLPSASQAVVKNASLFCATYKVPLDWTNIKNGRTINLQLIKVSANKLPAKGTVLTQPGGPGGSGVEEIISNGLAYREILGGQWNIIAFDPRGTGRTMPVVCNPVNASLSSLTRRDYSNFTIPQAEMYSIPRDKVWRDGGLYVEACAKTQSVADYASFISTPFAARDMLSIVDALGEDGKLRLWGRSYASVLGQTFVAMFPQRVGRIMIDSVFRMDDYCSGQWVSTQRDTEKVFLNFFRECIAIGTEVCNIANFTGPETTPESLLNELGSAFAEVLQRSITLPESVPPPGPWWQPGSLTLYDWIKYYMFTYAYYPKQYFAQLLLVNSTLYRDWDGILQALSTPPPTNVTTEPPWNLGKLNGFHSIACSDIRFRASKPEDMYSLVQAQQSAGSFLDIFGPQLWPCAQWKFKGREVFNGPFHAGNTSYPLLLINSPQDPITSLSGALEASANFLGSRLLVHNGHGHGSFNHPSTCTFHVIHDYFNNGTLPELGKVCQPDNSVFELAIKTAAALGNSTTQPERRSVGNQARSVLAQRALTAAKANLHNPRSISSF